MLAVCSITEINFSEKRQNHIKPEKKRLGKIFLKNGVHQKQKPSKFENLEGLELRSTNSVER